MYTYYIYIYMYTYYFYPIKWKLYVSYGLLAVQLPPLRTSANSSLHGAKLPPAENFVTVCFL